MTYILIETLDELFGLSERIRREEGVLYCDIESTGLDWFSDKILLLQIMFEGNIYIIDARKLSFDLVPFINTIKQSNKLCVFHNVKFDTKFILSKTGILLENVYDTMTAEAVLNAGIGKKLYGLAELAEKYCGVFMNKEDRKAFVNFPEHLPFTETMLSYSALDVKVLQEIRESQMERAIEQKLTHIVDLEMQLLPIAAKMEYDGINLDIPLWLEVESEAIKRRDAMYEGFKAKLVEFIVTRKFKNGFELAEKMCIPVTTKRLTKFLEEITDISTMRGWVYENFNVRSSKQMKNILHMMKIKVKNTDAKTLEDYKQHDIVNELLEIRTVNKEIDQYGSNFLANINPTTGKIHTEYFTVGTRTGRFSSNNPNLQNIKRDGRYRECFFPEPDYLFAAVDYSQQEYRLAGAVAREPVIIKAYQQGSDMHTATAQIVEKREKITKEERNRGKTVNFAILYGSTEYGLKRNLRINIDEATRIINDFWKGYPRLKQFMDLAGEKILELGYSCTPMGRKRYSEPKPTYGDSRAMVKWQEGVLREGRNFIIQGGGADIIKLALVEIYKRNPYGDKLKLCLQIHDEIVTQVHKSIAQEALEFIKNVMKEVEQPYLGSIPAEVEGGLSERWKK